MSYITTYGGIHFDPLAPRPEQILAEDIAHALSLICRGNGHVRRFYSVAQHSLACSYEAEVRGFSARVQLACLLHDAAEAYLSDVTRPMKALMPQLRAAEERLLDVIGRWSLKSTTTCSATSFTSSCPRTFPTAGAKSAVPSIPAGKNRRSRRRASRSGCANFPPRSRNKGGHFSKRLFRGEGHDAAGRGEKRAAFPIRFRAPVPETTSPAMPGTPLRRGDLSLLGLAS